jgi:hypothetical protein
MTNIVNPNLSMLDIVLYELLVKTNYPLAIYNIWRIIYNKYKTIYFNNIDKDGRINSCLEEKHILNAIHTKVNIKMAGIRDWYDFYYNDYFFNVKITSGGTDNIFNKKSIIYSLTEHPENDISKSMNNNKLRKYLTTKQKLNRNCKEYYYLVIFKDSRIPFVKSICDIQNLKSNPTNTLQVNWKKEYTHMCKFNFNKSFDDIRDNIISYIEESIYKERENSSDW